MKRNLKFYQDILQKKNWLFCVSFSEKDLSLYSKITKNVVKVPSHEAYNFKLIKKCIKTFKLVLISCGCLKKRELMSLLNLVANKKNVVLMHCVSSYPLDDQNIQLFESFFLNSKIFQNYNFSHLEDKSLHAISNGSYINIFNKYKLKER